MRSIAITLIAASTLAGCATVPAPKSHDADYLFKRACSPGAAVKGAKGSIWLKANSKEAQGQFPAQVESSSDPRAVKLEVVNLVGATEALITVTSEKYVIDVPGKKSRRPVQETGWGTWGGIPLKWAPDLFLGKIPCPSVSSAESVIRTAQDDGSLLLETRPGIEGAAERFQYHFRTYAGDLWPESLVWERTGAMGKKVEFKFDDPEDATQSPRKWEAKSAEGEVKVRWRDREVVR